jgi:hypothetical protein
MGPSVLGVLSSTRPLPPSLVLRCVVEVGIGVCCFRFMQAPIENVSAMLSWIPSGMAMAVYDHAGARHPVQLRRAQLSVNFGGVSTGTRF